MADAARAATPDTDEDMGLENDMRSAIVPSSPVPDASGDPIPVADSAADTSNPSPLAGSHHDGRSLEGRQRANAGIPPMHQPALLSKMSELPFRLSAGYVSEFHKRFVLYNRWWQALVSRKKKNQSVAVRFNCWYGECALVDVLLRLR